MFVLILVLWLRSIASHLLHLELERLMSPNEVTHQVMWNSSRLEPGALDQVDHFQRPPKPVSQKDCGELFATLRCPALSHCCHACYTVNPPLIQEGFCLRPRRFIYQYRINHCNLPGSFCSNFSKRNTSSVIKYDIQKDLRHHFSNPTRVSRKRPNRPNKPAP